MIANNEEQHRLWPNGEGLTWSTITNLIGEDDPGRNLRLLTLDLTDELFLQLKRRAEIEKELQRAESLVRFIKENLGVCANFGRKKMEYETTLRFIHDKNDSVIIVTVEDGMINVEELKLTIP